MILYHELNQNEAITFLKNTVEFPDQSKSTENEKGLQHIFENFCQLAQRISCQVKNPKWRWLRKLLKETFDANLSTKRIISVTTIKCCSSDVPVAKGSFRLTETYTTRGNNWHKLEAGGMSKVSQQNIIDQFAEGHLNLLVSTSVLEEGLNVVEYNLVVHYNHVTNKIARVQTQGQARANGSCCYAIMEMESPKVYQEQENKEKEDPALEALEHLPEGSKLKE